MRRFDNAYERFREFLHDKRLTISAALSFLVLVGVIPKWLEEAVNRGIENVATEEQVAMLRTQLGGISDVVAADRAAGVMASAGSNEAAMLRTQIQQIEERLEEVAAEVCETDEGYSDCLRRINADRIEGWQMYEAATVGQPADDAAYNQAIMDSFNEGKAAGIAESEARYVGKQCVPEGQFSSAVRSGARLLCGYRGDGEQDLGELLSPRSDAR